MIPVYLSAFEFTTIIVFRSYKVEILTYLSE